MIRPITTVYSLIALTGCVPEIRIAQGDVPAADRGLAQSVDTSFDTSHSDGVVDRGDDDRPDVDPVDVSMFDTPSADGAVLLDVPAGDTSGADVPADQGVIADASTPGDVTADVVAVDRPCGICSAPNASAVCVDGACRIDRCSSGFGDCNMRYADGCESTLDSSVSCGRCGMACGASMLCVSGTCVGQRSCPSAPELGCGLVSVAGGTYPFGTSSARGSDGPILVSVSALLVDTHEVTVARFRRYWEAGHPVPALAVRYPGGTRTVSVVREPIEAITTSGRTCTWSAAPTGAESLPINCVSWETAMGFCAWDGGRLPTEAEFEFIAAGRSLAGTTAPRRYPWGDQVPMGDYGVRNCDRAQLFGCTGDNGSNVRRVGSFPPTGGIYDLSGNVAEWQADDGHGIGDVGCLRIGAAHVDPLCTDGMGDIRGTRGGFFNTNAAFELPSAARGGAFVTERIEALGFRCVRSP